MAEPQGKNQRAITSLIAALNSNDDDGSDQAFEALGTLGESGINDALSAGLQSEDPELRVSAANTLGNLGAKAHGLVPLLAQGLNDDQASVRWSIAEALGNIGPEARLAIPALSATLRDPVPTVARVAAGALAKMGVEAVPALCVALDDQNPGVRGKACQALGDIGSAAKAAGGALNVLLKDKDSYVREKAAEALSSIGPGPMKPTPVRPREDSQQANKTPKRPRAIGSIEKSPVKTGFLSKTLGRIRGFFGRG
jgi:HEAT repeat protein